jgi:outer membrane lipoprotein carrier protein
MRRFALVSAALLFLSTPPGLEPAAAQQSAEQVAAALQAKYDRVRDFTADFTQEYVSGILRKKLTERGKLQIKKPGKMRWDYSTPDKKLFVSDGARIYLWVPADNTVTVSEVPKQDEATTAMQFLTGRGQIVRDFTISFTKNPPMGTYGLRLQPRIQERDYDWLELGVDHQTFQIRSLTAADRQGGQSTFAFSNFKENVGLPDTVFAFKIPRGADVINAGSSAR